MLSTKPLGQPVHGAQTPEVTVLCMYDGGLLHCIVGEFGRVDKT